MGELSDFNQFSFGRAIRKLRQAEGYSIGQYAIRARVSKSYLVKIENRVCPPPTSKRCRQMVQNLGIDSDISSRLISLCEEERAWLKT